MFHRIKVFHPFTWLVAIVVSAVLVLIMVPGEEKLPGAWREMTDAERELCNRHGPMIYVQPGSDEEVKALYTHGWPWPCVARGTFDPSIASWSISSAWPPRKPSGLPNWLQGDNWPFQVDVGIIGWRSLVLDVAMAVLLLIATTTAVEFWIRKRGGLLKFRLADLLVGLTLCGMVLGYIGYHIRLSRIEDSVGRHFGISRDRGLPEFGWSNSYMGPEWLARLVGHTSLPAAFYHHDHVYLSWDDSWASDVRQLVKLEYAKMIRIQTTSPRSAIERLATLPRLRGLDMGSFWKREVAEGETKWDGAGDSLFRPQDLGLLGELKIEQLWLAGDAILAEDVDKLLTASRTLKTVGLSNITATDDEVKAIRRRFPQVEISCDWEDYDGSQSRMLSASPHDADDVSLVREQRDGRPAEWLAPLVWPPPP